MNDAEVIAAIRPTLQPLTGAARDLDPLMELIGEARFVLIGEASHGTHEFYSIRAKITRRLIREKGFNAVAVEADWPDAYRINRYVRGEGDDAEAIDALGDFKRFPTWMWRNADVLDFVGWLRGHNDDARDKAGFYGVDLYSLYASMAAVIEYLDNVDPEAARRARYRYGCFEHAGEDPQSYGYAASFGLTPTCESEVVQQLVEIRRNYAGSDDAFYAEQNARLVRNAERYYRSMFTGRVSSWNLRDQHMAETIEALAQHVPDAKIVVWEHNSHLGDARATQMGREGELNVGQLIRQKHGDDARLIGFTTYHGTVAAASEWDGPVEHKRVRPGLPGSYEALLHGAGVADFLLPLRRNAAARALEEERLERAIGVIYLPATERISHYFEASLARQFDAVIHIDETRAVEPLERFEREHTREAPETYPSAL
ncbi:MAG TPA: erythromycin esterase family protein [Thermoanaerobaculia bacterium]|jgi:erythromycin esterase-like protein